MKGNTFQQHDYDTRNNNNRFFTQLSTRLVLAATTAQFYNIAKSRAALSLSLSLSPTLTKRASHSRWDFFAKQADRMRKEWKRKKPNKSGATNRVRKNIRAGNVTEAQENWYKINRQFCATAVFAQQPTIITRVVFHSSSQNVFLWLIEFRCVFLRV